MPPRPLTVLQLVPSLVSGGVERGTLEVAAELVRRGHRSLVVSGGGRLVGPLVNAGSEHISCPIGLKSPWTLRHVGTLRKLMVARQVDVVHARSRVPAWIGWLAWKSLPSGHRLRFVTTVHGLHSVNRFSEIMTRGEAVIAVSNSVREYLVSGFPRWILSGSRSSIEVWILGSFRMASVRVATGDRAGKRSFHNWQASRW